MSPNFFSWESLQLATIGALAGALRGMSPPATGKSFVAAALAGAIATPLFGPTVAVAIKYITGDVFSQENVWLLAGAITGVLGTGVVSFVLTFSKLLAARFGAEK